MKFVRSKIRASKFSIIVVHMTGHVVIVLLLDWLSNIACLQVPALTHSLTILLFCTLCVSCCILDL